MSANVELLLRELVDDAGLFPPTALPMAEALDRHRADARAGHPMHTQRFLCPAGRLPELRQLLTAGDEFAIGLIADRGADGLAEACREVAADPRLRLALVEAPLAGLAGDDDSAPAERAAAERLLTHLQDVPAGVPLYLEPLVRARAEPLTDTLRALGSVPGARPLGAKLRCGGVKAELFPTTTETARFLVTCVRAGVPFKATAGLHEAVRHHAPATGFTHHGYLNLLLATAVAVAGCPLNEVRAVLEIQDAELLGSRTRSLGEQSARAARRALVSYGSCSTATPVTQAELITGHSFVPVHLGEDRPA